jgi:penicillin amidase/acyl-homoserine-lactone acylase
LRAIEVVLDDYGTFTATGGDCYILMVEWDEQGAVHSESIHQFGAAVIDEMSPHYADQAPLFANEEMKPVLLTEEAVRAHLAREYRPGDFVTPWYVE